MRLMPIRITNDSEIQDSVALKHDDQAPQRSGKFQHSKHLLMMLVLSAIVATSPLSAFASAFFVLDTVAESGATEDQARIATSLVKTAVSSRKNDRVVTNEFASDFLLQPRLMRLGTDWILTVEKIRNAEIIFASQTKFTELEQLDRAARAVTTVAIEEPSPKSEEVARNEGRPMVPFRSLPEQSSSRPPAPILVEIVPVQRDTVSGMTSSASDSSMEEPTTGRSEAPVSAVFPQGRKVSYWTIGAGPFISRNLGSDNLMYGFTGGRTWDINPLASLKVTGDLALSSGSDGARYFDLSAGINYFVIEGSIDTAPYLTADLGYGFASDEDDRDAEGFSAGAGFGMQFFRTTETTLDLLLRYSVVLDSDQTDGNPSIIGVRLAVNF